MASINPQQTRRTDLPPSAPSIAEQIRGQDQGSTTVLYQCAFKGMTLAMAGRDAGCYHDVVAAGLRARHVHLYESALV